MNILGHGELGSKTTEDFSLQEDSYWIEYAKGYVFFILMLSFAATVGMAEVVFEGIFTDFAISRENFSGLEIFGMKAGLWICLLFFGGVALQLLYGLVFFVQPMMRVAKEGIWLQAPAKKFHLIEWGNIAAIKLEKRKIGNYIPPFYPLFMKFFTIRLHRKQKFIFTQKKIEFSLRMLSFDHSVLKQYVEKYSDGQCTVDINLNSKKLRSQ